MDSSFLGTFAKLQQAPINFIMTVNSSVHLSTWNDLVPTGWSFVKFDF
jgi:hypothetical protein